MRGGGVREGVGKTEETDRGEGEEEREVGSSTQ